MDRRLFVTGLVGVTATTALGVAMAKPANALSAFAKADPVPDPETLLPNLSASEAFPDASSAEFDEEWDFDGDDGEGFQLADHRRRHRRRRVRRWRRVCRRWWHDGRWRRSCRRRPYWVWAWFWV